MKLIMKNYVRIAVYEFVSIVYLFIYTALMRYIGDDGNPFIEHFFLIYFIIPNILWIVFGALISKSFGIVAETNKENLTLSIENLFFGVGIIILLIMLTFGVIKPHKYFVFWDKYCRIALLILSGANIMNAFKYFRLYKN